MQARWGTHGDHPIIALVPSTVRECYDLTVRAFNLAEKYRTPVYLLSDAVIGHMSEKIEIPEEIEIIDRKKPTVPVDQYNPFEDDGTGIPPMATYGDGYLWYVSGIIHDKTGFPATANPDIATKLIDRLHDKIDNNLDDIIQYEEYMTDDAEIVIFAYGSVARSAISAIKTARQEGIKVGLIRPITIWPFPEEPIKKLRQQAKAFIVPEMNYGQVYYKVKEIVEGSAPVKLISQYNSKLITPQQILSVLREER